MFLTVAAHTIDVQAMVMMAKTMFVGDECFHPFDPLRRKLDNFATRSTNEMLMVISRAPWFEASESLAEIVFVHQAGSHQQIEGTIHRRFTDVNFLAA